MSKKSPIIGIDLGTTYCCVAYLNANQVVEIIENKDGDRTTPSYVAFTDAGEIIGKFAKERVSRNPENVVYDAKRLIGQKFDDNLLQSSTKYNWRFKVTSDSDDTPLIKVTHRGKTEKYKPQKISAILLEYLKTIAEERSETEVKDAVITVPAHFNYHQRTATKEAGKLAGLNVVKIINEPTAAALAYIHKHEIGGDAKNIFVFDLGGGTLDVSIVTVEGLNVTVKATAGNTALGGRDFDNNLSEFIVDKIEKLCKREIKLNKVAMRRISEKSEKLKINLSSCISTNLDLSNLVGDEDVDFEITRNDFEQINSELFQTCIDIVGICLKDAKISKAEVDKIVLVGGSTRTPKIQDMLKSFFGGKQLTKGINPDEAVAYGAAVQAAMFNTGDKTEVHYNVIDVTPLSLGIASRRYIMNVVIPRNSKIPISVTRRHVTADNNQIEVSIKIYEGERPLVQHNTLIGKSVLKLPPKPVGYRFDVTFHISADGILEVSGKTADDDYTNLVIKYEKPSQHAISDKLKDAELNKSKYEKIQRIVNKWRELERYCTRIEAICLYGKAAITETVKITLKNICKKTIKWLEDNEVKDGSREEYAAILRKRKEIESVCEPIVNSYGYFVKGMSKSDFPELLTK